MTIFFLLSISLYMVVIPSKKEFINYKKSRRILGFAMMMIVVVEIMRILFPPSGLKKYLDIVVIIVFSLIFVSLIFVSYLYMIESSRSERQKVKKTAVISTILCAMMGLTGYIFIDIRSLIKSLMTGIYLVICMYEFTTCIREYDKLMMHMEANNLDKKEIKWLYPMLWATAMCALVMACAFVYKPLYLASSILSLITYTVLTMKLLSFIPANMYNARYHINDQDSIPELNDALADKIIAEEDNDVEIHSAEPNIEQPGENRERKSGYAKIEPLIKRWVEDEMYVNPDINIKEAALQMGTNSNYLSQYINKELNTSFATWLNTLRIEKSKVYLLDPARISIEECGMRVGYPNIYNFSRWFKIVTGMSPSEWRKLQ